MALWVPSTIAASATAAAIASAEVAAVTAVPIAKATAMIAKAMPPIAIVPAPLWTIKASFTDETDSQLAKLHFIQTQKADGFYKQTQVPGLAA